MTGPLAPQRRPTIPSVVPEHIPQLLKEIDRWVPWRAGSLKPSGKFDKFPVDPVSRRPLNALSPTNWLSFERAMDANRRGVADGVGFVLSDRVPVVTGDNPLYLTAIDLDHCGPKMSEHQALWRELGKPYLEISPSGRGLRMLGLTSTPLKGGNAGDGRELYSSGRFMTLTGVGGRGTLFENTVGLSAVEQRWFPMKAATGAPPPVSPPQLPETPQQIARVQSMLDSVSSETTYDTWRDIIWSLASTGWVVARQMAHDWSKTSPQRYDGAALDKLFAAFDHSRRLTLATLAYHARSSGWSSTPPLLGASSQAPLSVLSALLTADQLRQIPATPYVVRGVLPAQGLAAIYGEPGSGKSFLALHLAHAIATGAPDWFGFPVLTAPVVYVALEGQGGVGRRITALEKHSKELCPDGLRFWRQDIHLLTGDGIEGLVADVLATVGTGAVVIIDTLNQASPGADENSSQDMGKMIANAKHLAAAVSGLAILIHHAGKDRSRGLRGHSSLLAAMDAVVEVAKEPTGRNWRIKKAKDDVGDEMKDFDLVSYEVGQDAYGPINSCAVQQTMHIKSSKPTPPTGKNQKAALADLRGLLGEPGQSIEYKDAVRRIAAVLAGPKANDRAKEAVDALIRAGHLIFNQGHLTLA